MPAETTTKQLFICTSCGFIYDPDEGDPDGGIPPGTAFDDIPDDWFCPVCGARKKDFELHEGLRALGSRNRLQAARCSSAAPVAAPIASAVISTRRRRPSSE